MRAAASARMASLIPAHRSELARFGEGCAVVGSPSRSGCACGWGAAEMAPTLALARELLLARDVLRVRVGLWWIKDGVNEGNRHRIDPPLALRDVSEGELDRIDWKADQQLSIQRAGPPWPTELLSGRVAAMPRPTPARRRRRSC